MNVEQVDPDRLSISDLNERKGFDDPEAESGHIEIGKLTESVAEIGIVQPPLVRPIDAEFKDYEVVIGQRRTLAAQEVNNFDEFEDVEEIPIIVVEWDDGEALAASIVENVDAFREEVGTADRARAIDRLKDLQRWSDAEVADHIGVSEDTIGNWLEPIHPHWERVEATVQDESEDGDARDLAGVSESRQDGEDVQSIDTLKTIRRGSETPEESATVLQTVDREGLSNEDIREAKRRSADSGESMEETVTEVADERREQQQTTVAQREVVKITFSGADADALHEAAKESAATPNQFARAVIRQRLVDEGYL